MALTPMTSALGPARVAPVLTWLTPSPVDDTAHLLTGTEEGLLLLRAGAGAALALVLGIVLGVLIRRLGRRSALVTSLSRHARRPLRLVLVVAAVRTVAAASFGTDSWLRVTEFFLTATLIGSAAWLLSTLLIAVEEQVLSTYRVDVADNRHNRRVRTQVSFLRRLGVALVIAVAVAAMLLTIPEVRAVGTGILASAGLLSVVAGLAAQSALTNVFAGIQLAVTDAIRVDDVVVVETQFGKVEEITMTYVVVRLWDDRRMVLPSTYFTTTPFENWTRSESQLLGAVLLDVDWRTDFDALRAQVRRALEADDLWDGRVGVLQVTEAVGSVVQVRVLVSAGDAPSVFDLRCHVRESLVRWLVANDPRGLPRQRVENSGEPAPGEAVARPSEPSTWDVPAVRPAALRERAGVEEPPASPPSGWDVPAVAPGPEHAGAGGPGAGGPDDGGLGAGGADERNDSLFTGSTAAVQRSRDFSGPTDDDRRARQLVDATSGTRQVGVEGRSPRAGGPTAGTDPDDAVADLDGAWDSAAQDPDATRVLPRVPPA